MRRRTCVSRAATRMMVPVAIAGLLVAAAGCERIPTQTPPPPTGKMVISGTTALNTPGDTSQLTAVIQLTDGTTTDVTAQAEWRSMNEQVVRVTRGLLTAVGYGTTYVNAAKGTSSSSTSVRVQPEGTFFLQGRVTEPGTFTVADAGVQVSSPSRTFTARTGGDGHYVVAAPAGEVTMTVEKEGYTSQTKRLTMQRDETVDVTLQRGDATGLAGLYELTITASPSCKLPQELMRRRYLARIVEQSDARLVVDLSGAEFAFWGNSGFTGTRNGNNLQFVIEPWMQFSDYAVMERIDDYTTLSYYGKASGTIGGTSIVATLNGTVELSRTGSSGAGTTQCDAADHRMEFVRSGS